MDWNKWSCKLYLEGKVQLRHFYKKQITYHFLFSKPNNGAAFVPKSETSLAVSGEWPGFLLVSLKVPKCEILISWIMIFYHEVYIGRGLEG
jgi:hypothetical protein